jgi:hypothetical protein
MSQFPGLDFKLLLQSRISRSWPFWSGSLALFIASLSNLPTAIAAETSDLALESLAASPTTLDPDSRSAVPHLSSETVDSETVDQTLMETVSTTPASPPLAPASGSAIVPSSSETVRAETVDQQTMMADTTSPESAADVAPSETLMVEEVDWVDITTDAPQLDVESTKAIDLLRDANTEAGPDQEAADLAQTMLPETTDGLIAQTDEASSAAASGQGDLAAASQNPIGNLIAVPLQNKFNFGVGEFDRTGYTLNIEPVVPVPLSENLSLINRAIIPLSYQPELARTALPNGDVISIGDEFGLGDMGYQAYFVPKSSGSFSWGAGPFFLFPTATDEVLGTGKWGVGPTFAAVYSEGPIVAAILIDQLWSFAGDSDRSDVSIMTIEPGMNYNLDEGWALYFGTGNGITANWLADSGDTWTVPIGAGVGRTFTIGNQPMSMTLRGFWNAVKPEGAADWQIQFTTTLLFPQ